MKQVLLSILTVTLIFGSGEISAQSNNKGSATKSQGSGMKPVAFANKVAKIDPDNSKIEFIGIHVGDDPKPRLGGFKKFKGEVQLADDNSVKALKLEIDINSLWTQFDNLTTHLKNADFFETSKFPNAKFESTSISSSDKGMKITGNLMLHGVTKEISFIAKGKLGENGIVASSEFKLDRTMFGMDKMTSGVDKMVSLKFVIGQKTEVKTSAPGPGTSSNEKAKKNSETLYVLYAPNMT